MPIFRLLEAEEWGTDQVKTPHGLGEDMGKVEPGAPLVGMGDGAAAVGNCGGVLRIVNVEPLHSPAIPFLGILYPKELKAGSQRDVRTPVFP